MHFTHKFDYTMIVTRQELRLIGLALGGRIKDLKDITAAKALNVKILELLSHGLAQELTKIEDALEWATTTGESPEAVSRLLPEAHENGSSPRDTPA